ncbi:MAG: 4Fe-4S dicluster domain-containing protein, partial [archaeon]|nr:4Fe-4S dicluster domain-containing protein [archaeon]
AKKILSEAEDDGLVHKIFHVHMDPTKDVEAICNCCKCCCGIFNLYYGGAFPYHALSEHLAVVNEEECTACETCVDRCPMEAIDIIDSCAKINESKCLGCGVCANFCPTEAIKMEKMGRREIFVPPPRIKK